MIAPKFTGKGEHGVRVIYVDDEEPQIEKFRRTAAGLPGIDSLETFNWSEDALNWAKENPVDVAFLDIEMPQINGIELAKRLKENDENIRIFFVTAYENYALRAFKVDALGYLLKPYSAEDVRKELGKAFLVRNKSKKNIRIQTMPDLQITVDGGSLRLGRTKQEELLALLIDRGENGITKADAIHCLWSGYSSDSIYWTTMSRLKSMLEEAGIEDILVTKGQMKCINTEMVECDLYQMLSGDATAITRYQGEYLRRFSWAQERKAQLDEMKANLP